ncbi:MAG: tetratricopeptide repeat protein [Proteobacteria bacterium]|nr:tetratricopeptide repeat protein [Pseudomonadota bacterium]
MKEFSIIRKSILGVAGAVAAGALMFAPVTAKAGKDRMEPGRTLSGNYLAGRHALARKDLSAAADFLGAALKTAPEAPDLLRRTFILMAVEGRMKEATELARRLLKAKPNSLVAHLTLAVNDIKRGRFAAANKRLQDLPGNGLGKFVGPVLRGWSLVGEKKMDEALKLLTGEPQDKAVKPLLAMHAALINEMLGRHGEAEKHFLAVSQSQNGLSLRVVQLLGSLYERTGQPEKAKALYDRYLKEQPGSRLLDVPLARLKAGAKPPLKVFSVADGAAEALFGIASSLRQRNARETALVLGRLALYLKPRFPVMQILLGDILEASDRLEPSLALYSAIDRRSAFSWSARLRIASILDRLERTDESVEHLTRMAADNSEDPGPLISLGDILRSHDRFAESIDAYDRAFKRIKTLESRHWSLLYARGISLERSKQWSRAEADFLNALDFKPEQPYVLNYLGYSWIDKGIHIDRAQEMIRKAANLRPNDGYIIDSLGWGHYRLGDFDNAVRNLERAVELRPQDPIINDHLGDAYWRVGRRREADFQWRRALSLDPEDELTAKLRLKLKQGLAEDTETAKKPPNDG